MAGKGHAAFEKGSRLLENGDATGSLPYLEKAIAQFPDHYLAYYDLGVAHSRWVHTAMLSRLSETIDLTKGTCAAAVWFGRTTLPEGRVTQAERFYKRAVDWSRVRPIGKLFLGWAQFGLNHLIEAERSVEQACGATRISRKLLAAGEYSRAPTQSARSDKELESYLKLEPRNEQMRWSREIFASSKYALARNSRWRRKPAPRSVRFGSGDSIQLRPPK